MDWHQRGQPGRRPPENEPPEVMRGIAALRARVSHYLDAVMLGDEEEAEHDAAFEELEEAMAAIARRYGEGPTFSWAAPDEPPFEGEVAMPATTAPPLTFTLLSTAHAEAFIEGDGPQDRPDPVMADLLERVVEESLDFDTSPPSVRRGRILASDRDAAFVLGLLLIRGVDYEPDIGLAITDPVLHGPVALAFALLDLLGWVRTAAAHAYAATLEPGETAGPAWAESIERAREWTDRSGQADDPERQIRIRIDAAARLAEAMDPDERSDAAGRFSPVGRLLERGMIELDYDPWAARDACGSLVPVFAWGALGAEPLEADLPPEMARSLRELLRDEPAGTGSGRRAARLVFEDPLVAAYAVGRSWRATIDRHGFTDWRAPWRPV